MPVELSKAYNEYFEVDGDRRKLTLICTALFFAQLGALLCSSAYWILLWSVVVNPPFFLLSAVPALINLVIFGIAMYKVYKNIRGDFLKYYPTVMSVITALDILLEIAATVFATIGGITAKKHSFIPIWSYLSSFVPRATGLGVVYLVFQLTVVVLQVVSIIYMKRFLSVDNTILDDGTLCFVSSHPSFFF
eukprot:TRINITY_DN1945_c0_g2_i1.p1 TRINITY_DN1945_c0_g2~~TRINITY_DN1945_c0_g2_i1.p1  ORF type:complete len:191 (+),score=29.27 TRINITY_DN1945_c0_g2_i1:111-683(+)